MHAGVSTATVDRVLNRRSTVRRKTIEKVLASAEEIGFRATRLVETALNDTYLEKNLAVILLSQNQHFYKLLGESIQQEAYYKLSTLQGTDILSRRLKPPDLHHTAQSNIRRIRHHCTGFS